MDYEFLPELFLRAPYYSFAGYDPDRLPEVLADRVFRNALYLASPDFYRVIERKNFDFGSLDAKEKHTLYKYYNRMCFRPTPFGSFASFTLLEWGSGDTVRLRQNEAAMLHLLPDRQFISQPGGLPVNAAGDDLLIKNPSLYRLGMEYRYVRSKIDEKGHYRFSLDALPAEKFHSAMFSCLKGKRIKAVELAKWIVDFSGCSAEEADDYLGFLLAEQILYQPQTGYIINDGGSPLPDLPGLREFWLKYRRLPFEQAGLLTAAAAALEALLPAFKWTTGKSYFYAALERQLESGGPSPQDRRELGAAVQLLAALKAPFVMDVFKKFVTEFKERYDLEKVPLLTALDPDAGIPYGNFGIAGPARGFEDIRFPDKTAVPAPASWTAAHGLLFRLWGNAREHGRFSAIVIDQNDLSGEDANTTTVLLPPTLAVMFRKTADHLLIEHAGGAAAAALIGRFSAFSPQVSELCRKLAHLEVAANEAVVFADIGQLSNTHTDNINYREQIYPGEIPVNVYSVLPEPAQIQLEDLLVSVRNEELVLESVKLRKRVIPRLSTAYNYQHNELAVFRLLCDLQYQGLQANLTFNMENYFPGLNFYPRVVIGNTVIGLARWHLEEMELAALREQSGDGLLIYLRRLRERSGIPQKVSMGSADQELVFDLANQQEAQFFRQCIEGLKRATLTEYLSPGRSVKTGNKPLAGQFIAFLAHNREIYKGITGTEAVAKEKRKRNFLLGGDWLYVKIYCTPESSDHIIAGVILPVIRKNRRQIITWFFIRYFDKGYHLRLRIRTAAPRTDGMLNDLKKLLEKPLQQQLVRNYQGDIYRREMERYGSAIMEQVEEFFSAGSELAAQYTTLVIKAKTTLEDFQFGLFTAHRLISCFLDNSSSIIDFTGQMSARYLKEFAGNKQLKMDLDLKFRSLKAEVEQLLGKQSAEEALMKPFKRLKEKAAGLAEMIKREPPARRHSLLADLVHMQMNRTFRVKQRQQEFIVYYFLHKYILSLKARENKRVQAG